VVFARFGKDRERDALVCAMNLSPTPRPGYRTGLPAAGTWRKVLDTDAAAFGGSGCSRARPPWSRGRPVARAGPLGAHRPAAARRRLVRAGGGRMSFPFLRPLGATAGTDGTTTFRVWAHEAEAVAWSCAATPLARRRGLRASGARRCPPCTATPTATCSGTGPAPGPGSRWQPEGSAGPSAVVDPPTLAWRDGGLGRVSRRGARHLRAARRDLHPRGHLRRARGAPPAARGARRDRHRGHARRRVPRPLGWGYDGVYLSAAHTRLRRARRLRAPRRRRPRAGLAVILDVVYNHVGASGGRALEAFGPYFTEKYSTFWGSAINYDDEFCDPSASGSCSPRRAGSPTSTSTGCAWTPSTPSTTPRRGPSCGDRPPRPRPRPPASSSPSRDERPGGDATVSEGGLGHDAAWADDLPPRDRTLLTGDREGYYEEFGDVADLSSACPPVPARRHLLSFRRKRFGAARRDRRPSSSSSSPRTTTRSANRALGDRPARGPVAAGRFRSSSSGLHARCCGGGEE
jgi:maltooligosyltrehalose trehalohydrolase